MKKLLSLVLAFFLVFALVGCGECEHKFVNGKCEECGEPHDCKYVEGKCECGATHEHNYVDGKCECGATEETGPQWTFEGKTTELKEGFTSLANENANGAIDANGNYEVAGQKIKTKDVYKTYYTTEIDKDKLNYLCNSWTYNSEVYCNMIDGLVENDKYSNVVGALAVGYKTKLNDDGTQTWTFQLKEGVAWVDNATGEVVAEVTAEDFVSAIKYVLNPINGSSTATIVTSLVAGSAEYYAEMAKLNEPDFATVGVKAASKYEVEYTLYQATPYFLSSLTYSPFLPVYGPYIEEQGTDFGATVNNVLVNGAFTVDHKIGDKLTYNKNEKYYDKEHVYVNKVEAIFYDSAVTTVTTTREWFEAGLIDSFSVNKNDAEGWKKYVTGENNEGSLNNPLSNICNPILSVGTVTYIGYYNFARDFYEYTDSALAKNDAEKAATLKAMVNVNFRKGILYGLDVMKYLEYYNANNPEQWLMRGYTNRELTAYDGLDYADYVDAVFNEKQGTTGVSLTGIKNGSDPVYNAEKAGQYFATAKAELIAAGLTEADFPIKVDVIGSMNATVLAYEQAMYATVEAASNGIVKVQINIPTTDEQETSWASINNNYDFSMWSGWGPDYADPQTFAQTMTIDGFMIEQLGFIDKDEANTALEEEVLGAYTELFNKAAAIVDPAQTKERYEAFAEAEYALIYEYAIIVPWLAQNGYVASVANTIPYQAGRASYGLTQDKFKNVVVSAETITKEVRNAVVADYEANK